MNAMLNAIVLMVAFLSGMGVIAAIRIATSIAGPISIISDSLEGIAQGGGDLTVRLEERGDNEISAISRSFNRFIAKLNSMIGDVNRSADSMEQLGQALEGNASEISGEVAAIGKNISDLNFSVDEQSASVTETSATIAQIARNIESLTSQIEGQSAAVTQSSAAVQEMVSNIASISQNVAKSTESLKELKGTAAGGRGSISAVQKLATKLTAQSDSLLEANSAIDNIASQTNLLAMTEQNAGSRQALEALQEIESVAAHVRYGAVEMNAGTATILKEVARLSDVSQSVMDRSHSIAKSAEEISGTVAGIVRNTGENKEAVDTLVDMTGKFVL